MTKTGKLALNIRKLVAIEIVFLGFKLSLAEYVASRSRSRLAFFPLIRGRSAWQHVLANLVLINIEEKGEQNAFGNCEL